jgi:hypothetical protein
MREDAVLTGGTTYAEGFGGGGDWDRITSYERGLGIGILGIGNFSDGDTFTVDGTLVTVDINPDCTGYNQ